jgi:hypothetical protein
MRKNGDQQAVSAWNAATEAVIVRLSSDLPKRIEPMRI